MCRDALVSGAAAPYRKSTMKKLDSRSVVVLARDRDDFDLKVLSSMLGSRGIELQIADPLDLAIQCEGPEIRMWNNDSPVRPGLVIGWRSGASALHAIKQLDAIEQAGIDVLNSAVVLLRGLSPFLKSVTLQTNSVPHYPIISGKAPSGVLSMADRVGYPMVARPLMTRDLDARSAVRGQDIVFEDPSTLKEFVTGKAASGHFYMQLRPPRTGQRLRVFCVNHHPVACLPDVPDERQADPLAILSEPAAHVAGLASRAIGGHPSMVEISEDRPGSRNWRVEDVTVCPGPDPDLSRAGLHETVMRAQTEFLAARLERGPAARGGLRQSSAAHGS
ncbi:hypothetical protein [Streptomyces exfoliatus]|uniref:hypothetical protein n=1 Tax=Streptomyces exfoliatus TaxID=1905 RepID=UPI0012FEF124|nr:hypothetical protein [Streptomyces exfoliatus]